MWKAFLGVVRKRCSTAIHVLDRFHVMQLLSKAIDTVRRQEVRALKLAGRPALLTKTRWLLLKRRENMTGDERGRRRACSRANVRANLRSVRACLLKEQFQHFWTYRSELHAKRFLNQWTTIAMRSRIEPFKAFARTLRKHEHELLNWFAARGLFAPGATEGFNNKARIATRRRTAFGATSTPRSPCITRSASYLSPTGAPTDSADEASLERKRRDVSRGAHRGD
jgi:transposase